MSLSTGFWAHAIPAILAPEGGGEYAMKKMKKMKVPGVPEDGAVPGGGAIPIPRDGEMLEDGAILGDGVIPEDGAIAESGGGQERHRPHWSLLPPLIGEIPRRRIPNF